MKWVPNVSDCIWALQWRHNERDGVSNHQPHDCLPNGLFRCRSKKTSMLRVTGLCTGKSPHKGPVTRKMFTFDDVIMVPVKTCVPEALSVYCEEMYVLDSTWPQEGPPGPCGIRPSGPSGDNDRSTSRRMYRNLIPPIHPIKIRFSHISSVSHSLCLRSANDVTINSWSLTSQMY